MHRNVLYFGKINIQILIAVNIYGVHTISRFGSLSTIAEDKAEMNG